jgi:hypothetical protein
MHGLYCHAWPVMLGMSCHVMRSPSCLASNSLSCSRLILLRLPDAADSQAALVPAHGTVRHRLCHGVAGVPSRLVASARRGRKHLVYHQPADGRGVVLETQFQMGSSGSLAVCKGQSIPIPTSRRLMGIER